MRVLFGEEEACWTCTGDLLRRGRLDGSVHTGQDGCFPRTHAMFMAVVIFLYLRTESCF